MVCRDTQAAKGRLAVALFSGGTWAVGSVCSKYSCSLGPSLLSEHKTDPQEWARGFFKQLKKGGDHHSTHPRVGERLTRGKRVFCAEICSHLKKYVH